MLRRDALGLLAYKSDRSVSCPHSASSPIEARIYKRAIGLIGFSGALFARSILCLDDFSSLINTLLVHAVCVARSQALLVLLSATGPELGVRNLKPILRGLHGELKVATCDSKLSWAYGVSDSLLVSISHYFTLHLDILKDPKVVRQSDRLSLFSIEVTVSNTINLVRSRNVMFFV